MKAQFDYGFKGMSGKRDESIFYYHPGCKVCLVRALPKFEPNERTEMLKNVMANLKNLNPSLGYKQDFKDYLIRYNDLKENRGNQAITWSNLFVKMLYKMAKDNPEIDLLTLSREQIETQNLPCKTVKAAIEAGLLPVVTGYERLDAGI